MENQNSNVQFDFNKIPKSKLIMAGIALLGTLAVLLPWFKVSINLGFFGSSSISVNGFNSFFGVMTFLGFLGIAGICVIGEQILKMKTELVDKICLFGSIGIVSFCFIDLIRAIGRGGAYGASMPGFGLILAILCGVGLLLFALKVIKIK